MFESCIICGSTTNQLTKEHIVPEFVGGTLKVKFVCKTCNEKMSNSFETVASKSLLLALPRYQYGIESKGRGITSPLVGTGETDEKLRVHLNENREPFVHRDVSGKLSDDGRYEIKVTVDATERDKIPDLVRTNVLRHLKKEYPNLSDEQKNAIVEEALSNIPDDLEVQKSNSPVKMETTHDARALKFLFIKMAYEIAIYYHGVSYIEDLTGRKIRETIFNRIYKVEAEEQELNGHVPLLDDPVGTLAFRENNHTLLLFNDICYTNLFGIPGIIHLTDTGSQFVLSVERAHIFFFDYKNLTRSDMPYMDHLASLVS